MNQLGASADIVLVFATIEHWQSDFRIKLRDITQTERIVGCSGLGVLTGQAEVDAGTGFAVLALASDRIKTEPILYQPLRDQDREFGKWLAQKTAASLPRSSLLTLFPDTYNSQPQLLLQGLEEDLGPLAVVGAGCSENGAGRKTYQICGAEITTNAVAGLSIAGAFAASIGITQGCQPVTEPMTVTKGEGNFICEINHRPAFEVFARVIGAPLLANLRRALAFVFVGVPAERERNRVGPGEYLVRNIIGIDPEKGILAVSDEVWEGEKIVLTLRDGQRAREDLTQMLQRQAVQLNGRKPDFGLYFNCCARGSSLYGMPGIDTAYIRKVLGEFPLIGFFGNFELGPLGGNNHLLAYTGVLVLINET
ncbi:MAG: FIST N-terminal domain-containing protein [Candidatus Binatia bacterium]